MTDYLRFGFVVLLGLINSQTAWAQCDALFDEPEFGVVNNWKPKDRLFVPEVSFESACLSRTQCYIKEHSIRSRCDIDYQKDLSEVCRLGYEFDERLFKRCMQKVEGATELVGLEGAAYFRMQKRKAESLKRDVERKKRAEKRREKFSDRAEERRKKRLGR